MTDKKIDMEEIKGISEGSIAHPEAEKSYAVEKETQCPVCEAKASEFFNSQGFDGLRLECPNCGRFNITRSLLSNKTLKSLSQDEKSKNKISNYLKKYYADFNREFLLNSANFSQIYLLPENFLKAAEKEYKEKGISYNNSLLKYARQYKYLRLTKELEQSFHELIQKVEEQLSPEQRRTNAATAELMKKIAYSIKGDNYIADLAAGLGGLVWQLDRIDCVQDINSDVLEVAEFIAHQKENYKVLAKALDSIKELLPNDGKGIFLFDPPMGMSRIKPQEWDKLENSSKILTEIVGANYKNISSYTEVLFLLNFLLRADDNAYFICLVPETFLTKNENEYNSLRAYLIKNSLIAVIKPPASPGINTVVLFRQKKKEENKPVKLIVTKKYNNQEVIDYIFEDKAIKSEEIKSDSLNPSEITEPYLIKMPVIAESKGYEYIPSEKVIDAIIENEKILDDKKKPIISKEILKYKIFPEENKKESDEVIKVWWEEKSDISDTREKIVDARYPELKEIFDYFAVNGYFDKEEKEQEFNIALLDNFSELVFFLLLLTKGYIRKQEDKYIINTKRPEQQSFILNDEEIRKTYGTYLHPDQQKGDALVLLAYADEFVKKVYLDICLYYILDKNQSSTEVYSSKRADVLRALKILEKLGLVRTQVTTDKFIYSHYVPRYYFEGKWIYD